MFCVFIASAVWALNMWTGQTLGMSKWVLISMKGHIVHSAFKYHSFIFLIIIQINKYALIVHLIQEVKVKHGPVCPCW